MYNGLFGSWMGGSGFGFGPSPLGALLLLLVIAWSLAWKGLALWKSAREGSKPWFIVMLVVNTLGILEILYLFVFTQKSKSVSAMGEEKK